MQILRALCSSNWIISNYLSQKSGINTVYHTESTATRADVLEENVDYCLLIKAKVA